MQVLFYQALFLYISYILIIDAAVSSTDFRVTSIVGHFNLLKVFTERPKQPLSRDQIMQLARGRELDVFDRSIDVQISRIRKLIEDDPNNPKYLQTKWGFGYIFNPDGE